MDYERHLEMHLDMSTIDPPDLGWKDSGNDGTGVNLVAATDIVRGIAGGVGTEYDGVNERTVVLSVPFHISNSYSLWIKPGQTGVLETVLAHWDNPTIKIDFDAADKIVVSDGTGWALTSNGVLNVGQWYHVTITMSQSGADRTTSIFINGDFDNSMTHPFAAVNPDGQLDFANFAGIQFFAGIIDEVRIYSAALTPLQVADLHVATRQGRK